MKDLPIKNKEDFIKFANAYNRFVTFFLINLCFGFIWGICKTGSGGETATESPVDLLLLPIIAIGFINLILMIIAAIRSKSSYCITTSIIYIVVVFFISQLSFLALLVVLMSFIQTFRKYNVKINFYVPRKKMDAIWFCSCGNVCLEDFCPNCNHYKNECPSEIGNNL